MRVESFATATARWCRLFADLLRARLQAEQPGRVPGSTSATSWASSARPTAPRPSPAHAHASSAWPVTMSDRCRGAVSWTGRAALGAAGSGKRPPL